MSNMLFPSISMVAALPPGSPSPRMSPSSPSLNSGHSPTRVNRSMSAGESVLSATAFDGLPERDSEEFQAYLFGA